MPRASRLASYRLETQAEATVSGLAKLHPEGPGSRSLVALAGSPHEVPPAGPSDMQRPPRLPHWAGARAGVPCLWGS